MPFKSTRAKLYIKPEEVDKLIAITKSRTESVRRIERAKIILAYFCDRSPFVIFQVFKKYTMDIVCG